MDPLPLEGATRRLGAPTNWDHECDGLCRTLEIYDRNGWMISAWSPTTAELKRLNEGHPVFLSIQGASHPVVSLGVGLDPKAEPEGADRDDGGDNAP